MTDDDSDFEMDAEFDAEIEHTIEDPDEVDELRELGVSSRLARAVWRDGELHVIASIDELSCLFGLGYQFGLSYHDTVNGLERLTEGAVVAILGNAGSEAGELELTVRFLFDGPQFEAEHRAAERAIVEWAACTGYARVWLPDQLVEIEEHPSPGTWARGICHVCGNVRTETGREFWRWVFECGHFPFSCPVCSANLGHWEVMPKPKPFRHPAASPDRRCS